MLAAGAYCGVPKTCVQCIRPNASGAATMPTLVKLPFKMFAQWPLLFIQPFDRSNQWP